MKKIIFYLLLFVRFNKFLSFIKMNKKEIITLMFHRINNEKDILWPSMKPENFEKLIKLLKNNTKIISIDEIFSNSINKLEEFTGLNIDIGDESITRVNKSKTRFDFVKKSDMEKYII